jgi:hypothetical protein
VSNEVYTHWVHLFQLFACHLMRGGLLDDEIPLVLRATQQLLAEGARVLPAVWHKPCGHGLVELVKKAVPSLRK